MIKRISRFAAALGIATSSLFMGAPIALADVSTDGPDSPVSVHESSQTTVTNTNNVTVTNQSYQVAKTGDATVSHNTTGGDATSGNASNTNMTETNLQINNMAVPCGSCAGAGSSDVSTQGPNSPVSVHSFTKMTITNNNNVSVTNRNTQIAKTGDATVSHNTTGGSATSGNASNENNTSTCISINNSAHHDVEANCPANQPGGGQGGGGQGGQPSTPAGGAGSGQVMGASFTVASIAGGRGAGFATLPNTGASEGVNFWIVASILVAGASIAYWNKAIAPRLKD